MKINLEVIAAFDLDGNIQPKAIVWEDGRVFEIDRVLGRKEGSIFESRRIGYPVHLPDTRQGGKVVQRRRALVYGKIKMKRCR